ncbi:MAG: hypothetical protein QXU13_04450 [Desulfurococcaceae archaeon]
MESKKPRRIDPREKVLRVLVELGECNFNKLLRETGLSYYSLVGVLEELMSKGVVIERRIGRLRLFRISKKHLGEFEKRA